MSAGNAAHALFFFFFFATLPRRYFYGYAMLQNAAILSAFAHAQVPSGTILSIMC